MRIAMLKAIAGLLMIGIMCGCAPAKRATDVELRATADLLGTAVCLGEIRERFPGFDLRASIEHAYDCSSVSPDLSCLAW